jgi:hypothetical protein
MSHKMRKTEKVRATITETAHPDATKLSARRIDEDTARATVASPTRASTLAVLTNLSFSCLRKTHR